MNIKLLEIISSERQRYIDFFLEGIELLSKDKQTFATELVIQTNDQTNQFPFNVIRVDFITKDKENEHSISELRLDRNLNYHNLGFNFNNLKLFINPFCWNSCEFQVDTIDTEPLKAWIIKWLKVDNQTVGEKLSTAVHSCTKPDFHADKFWFNIDLGTAKEDALIDFFEMLNDSGTTQAIIQTTEF